MLRSIGPRASGSALLGQYIREARQVASTRSEFSQTDGRAALADTHTRFYASIPEWSLLEQTTTPRRRRRLSEVVVLALNFVRRHGEREAIDVWADAALIGLFSCNVWIVSTGVVLASGGQSPQP